MLEGFRGEVRATRREWIGDASFYGANVRDARERGGGGARLARWRGWRAPRFPGGGPATRSATWRVAAFQKRRSTRALCAAPRGGGLTHTRLAKATAAAPARRARRGARRAVARAVRVADAGATRRAFGAWRRATLADADAKRHERLVAALQRRAAGKMRLASASRAVAGWRERTRERSRLRGILRKTHARWTRAATADTFYAWLSVASGKRRRRARLSQLVLRAPQPRAARRVSRLGARGACGEKGTTCPVRAEPPVRPERAAVVLPPVERWETARARRATRASRSSPNGWSRAGTASPRPVGVARTVAVRLRAARGRGGRRRRW